MQDIGQLASEQIRPKFPQNRCNIFHNIYSYTVSSFITSYNGTPFVIQVSIYFYQPLKVFTGRMNKRRFWVYVEKQQPNDKNIKTTPGVRHAFFKNRKVYQSIVNKFNRNSKN